MINPFDLSGPEFLVFYISILCACFIIIYFYWLSLASSNNLVRPISDPYQIAYLRGGSSEAVTVAAASLVHRKLAKVSDDIITASAEQAISANNKLEKVILEECIVGLDLKSLTQGRAAHEAKKIYHQKLMSEDLILSDKQQSGYLKLKIVLISIIVVVAGTKIIIALQRGRYNLQFLAMLCIFAIIGLSLLKLWRTPKGKTALRDLKVLFKKLRNQATQFVNPVQNHHFTFLIAVFGISAVRLADFIFLSAFQPKNHNASSCSSSCSSSSCGGGCGGGCGGCGS